MGDTGDDEVTMMVIVLAGLSLASVVGDDRVLGSAGGSE